MNGILYGIGVGPGDPELMTLKAVKCIGECDIIALPNENVKNCKAYMIASQAVPSIRVKEICCITMPMTKDKTVLERSHKEAARIISDYLKAGKKVGFLTLGDPTIYSTYIYIHQIILKRGYHTEIINGIPSFCAAAARLNMGLVENSAQLHIIPASYPIEKAAKLSGTKVLMKAGKAIHEVKKVLNEQEEDFYMVENCGMAGERICHDVNDISDDTGYYTLIILKGKNDNYI